MSWVKNNEWLKPDEDHSIRWSNLKRFLVNYRPFRWRLTLAAILALLGAITAFLIPVIFRMVQDAIVAQDVRLLVLLLAGFLAISLMDTLTSFGIRIVNSRVSTLLNRELVLQYYRKVLNLAVEELIAFRRRTNLYQRLIDAMSITGQCTSILVRGGRMTIVLVVVATVIGTVSLPVLGVLALGATLLFLHSLLQARRLASLRKKSLAINYPLVGKMSEIINGLFTIKALAASVRVTSDIRGLVERKTAAEYNEQVGEVQSDQIGQAIRAITLVAAVGTSCALMINGSLPLADVFSLYILTNLLLAPVTELAIYYQLLSRLSVNVGNFYEVLDLQDEASEVREARRLRRQHWLTEGAEGRRGAAVEGPRATAVAAAPMAMAGESGAVALAGGGAVGGTGVVAPTAARIDSATDRSHRSGGDGVDRGDGDDGGYIRFQDVHFAYRDGNQVLKGLNLEVQPGEKVSLIGRSGVGKTTLLRLLLGFLQPQGGEIQVDDTDVIRLEDKGEYRRQFGVVSQQDFLFGTSIRENLTFGLEVEEVTDDEIGEALRRVDLWDDVRKLDEGLDTLYSQDIFSGGQKQRFFIARALLRKPRIVLLDEPTSALDFESEARVMEAVDRLVSRRTTLTIAHRLSTVRNADRVIVLHDGVVKATGSHEELYARDDYYRSLCDYNSFVV